MGIERNPDILFWSRAKSRAAPYVRNCSGMQLVLPNPTTLAIPATAGLVHSALCRIPDYAESVHETSGSRSLEASACGITQSTAADRHRCGQACVPSDCVWPMPPVIWSDPAERTGVHRRWTIDLLLRNSLGLRLSCRTGDRLCRIVEP